MDEQKEESLTEQEIISRYQLMRQECQQIVTKVSELEFEANEHRLVINTISSMDPDRKAFRLISGVLVEQTVGEVLPAVEQNLEGITKILQGLKETLARKDTEAYAWKQKYGIRTQREMEAQSKKASKQSESASPTSSGVLA